MYRTRMLRATAKAIMSCLLALLVASTIPGAACAAQPKQKTFETPEAAVSALIKALKASGEKDLLAIFGPGSEKLISSGDKKEDLAGRRKFIERYNEKNLLEAVDDHQMVLRVGSTDWPFPMPLVKEGKRWRFDTMQGLDELLSRRIGKNELAAIRTCLAIADAEREYATEDRDGDGMLAYAQKFVSAKGKKDGLYWKAKTGDAPSPLGPLVAKARSEGYRKGEKPQPYNGYFFRILTEQGESAAGGAYSYLVKGKMSGGFAVEAYPARYLASGVKTFIVNQEGVVYQKDLGDDTAELAAGMKEFNPDATWEKARQ
jgi:hypothetical protein